MNPIRQNPRESAQPASYRQDLWRSLPPAAAEALRRRGAHRRYADGATLVQRGQPIHSVLVLNHGRLRSLTVLRDGHEHLIRWVEPGEAVGVASVLAGLPFQTDLIASGDCMVQWIPGGAFIDAMRGDAEVSLAVAKFLAARLSEMFDHVADQAQLRLRDRLRAALLHIAAENGKVLADGRVELRVTQQDMSDAVGASRQRVNEALGGLQRSGHVTIGYRRITVDPTSLRSLGDNE